MSDRYRILIVEDDALIAMELAERLADMGYEVLGPAHSIAEAETILATAPSPDAALLDANVGGESSVTLGATLAARGVAVGFCTGYDEVKNLPASLRHAPVLTKPVSDADLTAGLKRLVL